MKAIQVGSVLVSLVSASGCVDQVFYEKLPTQGKDRLISGDPGVQSSDSDEVPAPVPAPAPVPVPTQDLGSDSPRPFLDAAGDPVNGDSANNDGSDQSVSSNANTPSVSVAPSDSGTSPNVVTPGNPGDGVWINVHSVVVSVKANRSIRSVVLARNLGLVNMAALSANVLQALGNLSLPIDEVVKEIRLMTYDSGNVVIENGATVCDLMVPSGSSSGVKLKMADFLVEAGMNRALSFHFDAGQSVVHRGNGLCNLKPSFQQSVEFGID